MLPSNLEVPTRTLAPTPSTARESPGHGEDDLSGGLFWNCWRLNGVVGGDASRRFPFFPASCSSPTLVFRLGAPGAILTFLFRFVLFIFSHASTCQLLDKPWS